MLIALGDWDMLQQIVTLPPSGQKSIKAALNKKTLLLRVASLSELPW